MMGVEATKDLFHLASSTLNSFKACSHLLHRAHTLEGLHGSRTVQFFQDGLQAIVGHQVFAKNRRQFLS